MTQERPVKILPPTQETMKYGPILTDWFLPDPKFQKNNQNFIYPF